MRKFLLLLGSAFMGITFAQAQCSPDPQYTESGIYPDSATNFAPACVGEPYTQVITNVVPEDTTTILPIVGQVTVAIDSINVVSVTGLPPGMTFQCNPSSCSYAGGTTGCAIISGTCNTPGTYNLVFELTAYVEFVGAQDFTLDYYKIVVQDCGNVSLIEKGKNPLNVYPNPTKGNFTIDGLVNLSKIEQIQVVNMAGQVLSSQSWNGTDFQEINLDHANAGIYFVSVSHANGTQVVKLIKE